MGYTQVRKVRDIYTLTPRRSKVHELRDEDETTSSDPPSRRRRSLFFSLPFFRKGRERDAYRLRFMRNHAKTS